MIESFKEALLKITELQEEIAYQSAINDPLQAKNIKLKAENILLKIDIAKERSKRQSCTGIWIDDQTVSVYD